MYSMPHDQGVPISVTAEGDCIFVAQLMADALPTSGNSHYQDPYFSALWRGKSNGNEVLAIAGDPAPSRRGELAFTNQQSQVSILRHLRPVTNRHGDFVVPAWIHPGGFPSPDPISSLLKYIDGMVSEIAVAGEPAPGLPGYEFGPLDASGTFYGMAISDAGEIAFKCHVHATRPDTFPQSMPTVWTTNQGQLELVATESDSVASYDACAFPYITQRSLAYDGQGRLCFVARADVRAGVWVYEGSHGSCRLLIPDPAALNVTFNELGSFTVNQRGDVLFGMWRDGLFGLWLYASEYKSSFLVFEEGQDFDVSVNQDGTDVRTVRDRSHSTATTAYAVDLDGLDGSDSLSDAGHVAVTLRFTDGSSGVFVMRLPAECPADLTSDTTCAPGEPDGLVTLTDFSCFLSLWSTADPIADITRNDTCLPASGGDGVSLSDFSCYLSVWSQGCP